MYIKLLLTLLIFAAVGCSKENDSSDGDVNGTDVMSEFLNKYGDRDIELTDSMNLSIYDTGELRLEENLSDNCKLTYDGQIESVVLVTEDSYSIKYRYFDLSNELSFKASCNPGEIHCKLEVEDCERAISDNKSKVKKTKSKIVDRNSSAESLFLSL